MVAAVVVVVVERWSTGTASSWLLQRHYSDFVPLYAAETQCHRLELEIRKPHFLHISFGCIWL